MLHSPPVEPEVPVLELAVAEVPLVEAAPLLDPAEVVPVLDEVTVVEPEDPLVEEGPVEPEEALWPEELLALDEERPPVLEARELALDDAPSCLVGELVQPAMAAASKVIWTVERMGNPFEGESTQGAVGAR